MNVTILDSTEQNISSDEDLGCLYSQEWRNSHRLLLTIGPVIIIFIGTTGNTVAYFVLKQRAYKNNVMASALRYLAIMDTIILWTVVLRLFLKGLFDIDLARISTKICLLFQLYTLVMTSCDNWLLVIITLTRLIHLQCPFRSHAICSKFNYYSLMIFTHLCVLALHGWVVLSILKRADIAGEFKSCYMLSSKEEAESAIHMSINVIVNFLAPGSLLLAFNFLIARELKHVEERENRLRAKPMSTAGRSPLEAPTVTVTTDDPSDPEQAQRRSGPFGAAARDATQNALEYELDQTTHRTEREGDGTARHDAILLREISVDRNGGASGCEVADGKTFSEIVWPRRLVLRSKEEEFALQLESIGERGEARLDSSVRGRPTRIKRNISRRQHRQGAESSLEAGENMSGNALSPGSSQVTNGKTRGSASTKSASMMSATTSFGSLAGHRSTKQVPRISVDTSALGGGFSSSTTIKSTFSKNLEVKTRGGMSPWGSAMHRMSTAWHEPIELDMESWPSADARDCKEPRSQSYPRGGAIEEDESLSAERHTSGEAEPCKGSVCKRSGQDGGGKQRGSRIHSLTRLLMMASMTFICLNLPYWAFHLGIKRLLDGFSCHRRRFIRHVVLLLRYSNHSLNFFFYCASGSRFRQELLAWLRARRRSQS